MFTFLSILYVIVCLFLILVVLLQSGKGGGMGAIGGGMGGAGTQVFGGAGAGNILTKATAWSAALFMILSATLSYLSSPGEQALERVADSISGAAATATEGDAAEGAAPEAGPPAPTEAAAPAEEPSEEPAELAEDEVEAAEVEAPSLDDGADDEE
ncbi:MAG: preprotein translocase subunit SecG [Myxococcales bacterium]|nr:preprotein translocase subunit SecG [Myxococcales bacterium]